MHSRARLLTIPAIVGAIAGLTFAGTNPGSVSPAGQADSLAIANVVNDFHNALSKGDSAKALDLLAIDAVILESGEVESRSEYRSHHLPEDIKFAKAVASRRGPLQVRVEGASAWTAATSTTKGEFKGKPIDSIGAESMVLTRETAGWRIRSIHWSSRKRTSSP
jgi:ketosteroid isomerase-like protein